MRKTESPHFLFPTGGQIFGSQYVRTVSDCEASSGSLVDISQTRTGGFGEVVTEMPVRSGTFRRTAGMNSRRGKSKHHSRKLPSEQVSNDHYERLFPHICEQQMSSPNTGPTKRTRWLDRKSPPNFGFL